MKHFKFVQRGKKRIHTKPDAARSKACRWWIDQERALIRPPLTVALGATAARSLVRQGSDHHASCAAAALTLADGSECWVTIHPSFLLRLPDEEAPARRARKVRRRPQADPRTRRERLAA